MVGLAARLVDLKRTVIPADFRRDRYAAYDERLDEFSLRLSTIDEVTGIAGEIGITSDDLVLDFGCGNGVSGQLLARKFGCRVAGIDIDLALVQAARARGVKSCWYDGVELMPFDSEQFDVVTCFHTIAHVPDPVIAMSEMLRVLKPGGRIAVVTPNRWYTLAMLPKNLVNSYRPDMTVLRYFDRSSLRKLMTFGGLTRSWTWYGGEQPWAFAPSWTRHRVFGVGQKVAE